MNTTPNLFAYRFCHCIIFSLSTANSFRWTMEHWYFRIYFYWYAVMTRQMARRSIVVKNNNKTKHTPGVAAAAVECIVD